MQKKAESRVIPEETTPKFFAQNFKPYVFIGDFIKGKKVLEVGCGDGYGAHYLSGLAKTIIALDYEPEVVLQAKNKYKAKGLQFISMDAAELALKDALFEAVCSFQVIEHIPQEKLMKYLSEIKRVLKKGGRFYLSTLNLAHAMKSPRSYQKNPAHCQEFRLYRLKAFLAGVFRNVEVYGLHLSAKHNFIQRLKKIGIFNILPANLDPVKQFYARVSPDDFIVSGHNLEKASDFICICYD
ncbi:MAG: class I SAM-dependent methyltransferase [Candidatus Omnitrophota bacterium]